MSNPTQLKGVRCADNIDLKAPLLEHTQRLFSYVSTHNFDDLAALCDDDFGIVDLDPEGKNVMIRTRTEWEQWFQTLFQKLKAMGAKTTTTITKYDVLPGSELTMTVVEFDQHLHLNDQTHDFGCVATIVWKLIDGDWKEARWHVSLIDAPKELG